MTYTWIDYLIIVIFALSMAIGVKRGFIKEVIALITLIAAFFIAITFSGQFANWLNHFSFIQSVVNSLANVFGEAQAADALSLILLGLSFFILFLLVVIVGSIIKSIISSVTMLPGLGIIDRFLGIIFGAVRGFLLCVAILFLLSLTSIPQDDAWTQSRFRPTFQSSIAWLSNVVKPGLEMIKDALGKTIGNGGADGVYHNSMS